jgi:hypothetical protein
MRLKRITGLAAAAVLAIGLSAFGAVSASGSTIASSAAPTSPSSAAFKPWPRPMSGFKSATEPNYAYTYTYVPIADLSTVTSGSVDTYSDTDQGTIDHAGTWGSNGNHSLVNLYIAGTCNGGCSGAANEPEVEIMLITGTQYCNSGNDVPCFRTTEIHSGDGDDNLDYTEAPAPYGVPDNGSYHLGTYVTTTLGYELSYGRVNITINGNIVGWFPENPVWGQLTFGPLTTESLQTEAFATNPDWGVGTEPSMDYTYRNFTDSAGNTIPTTGEEYAPAADPGYSVSATSSTGYTASGGRAPDQSGTYWPIELSGDNGMCVGNRGNTKANNNPIVILDCTANGEAENWSWDKDTQEIVNQDGDCLEDPGDSQTNGTQLVLYACNGNTGELWQSGDSDAGNDYWQMHDYTLNMCINNPGNSTTSGNPVAVYGCNSTAYGQALDSPFDSESTQ